MYKSGKHLTAGRLALTMSVAFAKWERTAAKRTRAALAASALQA